MRQQWTKIVGVYDDIFRAMPIHWRLLIVHALMGVFPYRSARSIRTRLYRLVGFDIDLSTVIYAKLNVWGGENVYRNLHVGRLCRLNAHVVMDLNGPVTLGDAVVIGHGVTIITATHPMDDPHCRAGAMITKPVTIKDGAWIAANATILPGVTIGEGAVVGAGSVVTRDVPPHTLVAGNPIKHIRTLNVSDRSLADNHSERSVSVIPNGDRPSRSERVTFAANETPRCVREADVA